MSRVSQTRATRGSQRWIQDLVNDHPAVLDGAVGLGPIDWRSPIANDEYAEYCDDTFLTRLGISLSKERLSGFWPARGPQWDALGRTESGEIILVEAKSHVGELASSPCGAGDESRAAIRGVLERTAAALGAREIGADDVPVKPGADWHRHFYQYANRLAHGYLLRGLNDVPAHIVFVYFIGDDVMKGPQTRREWETALQLVDEVLGLRGCKPKWVRNAFIDVRSTPPTAA